MSEPMYEYKNHLTAPPIPVGGYTEKTMSDEEIGKIIKDQADMCVAILNGDENKMDENKCSMCGSDNGKKSPKKKICPLIYDPCIGEDCMCFNWVEFGNGNKGPLRGYCKEFCTYTGDEKEGDNDEC